MSAIETLSREAVDWLVYGEHGISSKAIFHRTLLGRSHNGPFNYPHDPDDFRRCELLLRAVPECRERLYLMAAEGPVWRALVERWDDIVASIESEVPGVFDGGRRHGWARESFAFMSRIMDEAREVA